MESIVHPTAVIEKGAELDEGVIVGAYAFIGPHAKIGSGRMSCIMRRLMGELKWEAIMRFTHTLILEEKPMT